MNNKEPLEITDKATFKKAIATTAAGAVAMTCGSIGALMLCGGFNTASSPQTFAVSTQVVQQLDPAQDRQTLAVDWNKARQEQADSTKRMTAQNKQEGKILLSVAALGLIGYGAGFCSLRKKLGRTPG